MENVPDEDLMAYADDALPPDERARIEALLASDPALRARLEPLILSRGGLNEIFGPRAREPIPERLIATIMSSGRSGGSPSARNPWAAIFPSISEMLLPGGIKLVPVVALSVVALTTAVTFWLLRQPTGNPFSDSTPFIAADESGRYAAGELAVALNTTPSGKTFTAKSDGGAAGSITPVFSFLSNDNRYCRQYRIESPTIGRAAGLACRGEQARAAHETWRIVIHSQISPHAPAPGEFRPASGSGSPAVDAAVNGLIEGDALEPNEEAELIGNAWIGAAKP